MDTAAAAVSPAPSLTGELAVPLPFSGMDRACPCLPQHMLSDLEVQVLLLQECDATLGDISLDDGSCQVPDEESRSGYYTSQLGLDGLEWETPIDAPTDAYYGEQWASEGVSDVEDLDTASVEVSLDEDDLASLQAEVSAT